MNHRLAGFSGPLSLVLPHRLTAVSAWLEHIPFAMDLIGAVRPRILVELGTHAGDSYCAFCQAVSHLSLETRCFAVDTWQGDEHAGRYGPEVLAELRAHHDPAYGQFSTLVQSTFESARTHYTDGSIDLLHIDGYHTYEAVRDDLEVWLPKLSRCGVVLLHDTNVRERNFGVWRVWEENRARFPSFEFMHGHGLGVLAVGPDVPQSLRLLLEANEEERYEIRTYYAELGKRNTLVREVRTLSEALSAARTAQADLTTRLASAEAAATTGSARVAAADERAAALSRERDAALVEAARAYEEFTAQLAERDAALVAQIADCNAALAAVTKKHDVLATRVSERDAMLARSRLWRLACLWWRFRGTEVLGRAALATRVGENSPDGADEGS